MSFKHALITLLSLLGLFSSALVLAEPVDAETQAQLASGHTDAAVASVYLMLTSLGGSPGAINVELNGTQVGELHPGAGMVVELIPETRNFLLVRSRFAGINSIKLDAPAAGEKRFYNLFVDIFNPMVLRLDRMAEQEGEQLAAKIRFVKPDVSLNDPRTYPGSLQDRLDACEQEDDAEACESRLLDQEHVPEKMRAVHPHVRSGARRGLWPYHVSQN